MAGKQSEFWKEHGPLLREMAEAGMSDAEIVASGKFGDKGHSAIVTARQRLGIKGGESVRDHRITAFSVMNRTVTETADYTITASDDADEEPFDELLGRAIKQTKRDAKKAISRRFCVANIITTKPIALVFKSDQHLTMHGPCDVERAFEDARVVQQTQGMYCLLGGDGVDNHIKHRAALVGKGSRPVDEYRLYDGYLRTLGHKVLAMISGNHDDWTKDAAGVDMVGMLAARNKMHFAPDVVVMTVRLLAHAEDENPTEYTIKLRHQYRFGSSLNLTHTVKRMYDMDDDPFDVGVVCHNHEAEVGTFNRHGSVRYAIRPGSYQVESSFSRRIGFGQSYPTCPGVVLFPGEKRISLCEDLRDAVEKLRDSRTVAQAA